MRVSEASAPALDIRLFGPFSVHLAGRSLGPLRSRRGAWLLALLVLRHGREVQREWLAGLLWPESDTAQSLGNLRRTLTDLRAALGDQAGCLRSPTPYSLRLDLSRDAFADVVVFDSALDSRDPARLEEAIALYHGPLLEGCSEEWIVPERAQRAQAYLTVLDTLADRALQEGCPLEAVRYLRLGIASDPLHEGAYRRLMHALAAAGDFAAVTQCYRDLRLLLRRELNADPDPETTALYQTLREAAQRRAQALTHPLPSSRSPVPSDPVSARRPHERPPGRLPAPLSSFIGRETERWEVQRLLAASRLVTLTGTGGIGKTRLAIQVAAEAQTAYPGGVWFVDLAPLSDPALVPQTVAQTLGIKEEAGRPLLDSLAEALGAPILLLLDNCERLAEACARFAETLLSRCPDLRLLATSRTALNVQGGVSWRVPSLLLPASDAPILEDKERLTALREYDGIRLFVERAQLQRPEFTLSGANAPSVVQICQRLDGIPLAIELAAARIQGLSVEQIQARLDDRFRLLSRGNQGALPRHQTLAAAMAWSYDLLSPAESLLLRRLAVFAGGWSLEAAEAICTEDTAPLETSPMPNPTPLLAEDVADLLAQLVDKSLVIFETDADGQCRYRMLETVRQYADLSATDAEEKRRLRQRHLDWYLAFAQETIDRMDGPEQRRVLEILETEHDNLRAALDFAAETPAGAEAELQLAGALHHFWSIRGYLQEGRRRCEAALRRPEAQGRTLARVQALYTAGVLAFRQFVLAEARAWLEEGLALCRELNARTKIASYVNTLGLVALEAADYPRARSLFQESLERFRKEGDTDGEAASLNNLGRVACEQGDYAAARPLHTQSLHLWRQQGNLRGIGSALVNLGNLAQFQGDFAEARTYYEESLRIQRELGNRSSVATILSNLGLMCIDQGDYTTARAALEESLQIRRELGNRYGIATTLNHLGNLSLCQNDLAAARDFLEASLSLAREIGDKSSIATALNNLGILAERQQDLPAAQTYLQESLALQRELGDATNCAQALANLGALSLKQDDITQGLRYLGESMRIRQQLGDKRGIAWLLNAYARLATRQQQWERAVTLFAAADALYRQVGMSPQPLEAAEWTHDLDVAHAALPVEAFTAAWEQGRQLSWQDAATLALEANL